MMDEQIVVGQELNTALQISQDATDGLVDQFIAGNMEITQNNTTTKTEYALFLLLLFITVCSVLSITLQTVYSVNINKTLAKYCEKYDKPDIALFYVITLLSHLLYQQLYTQLNWFINLLLAIKIGLQ